MVLPPQCSAFRALELDILVVELGLGPGDYIRLFTLNLGRLAALHIAQIIQRRVLAAARLVIFQGRGLAALARCSSITVLEHLLGLGSGGIHFLAGRREFVLVTLGVEQACIVGVLDAGNKGTCAFS